MILMTAKLIKLLLAAAAIAEVWWMLRKKTKKLRLCLMVLAAAFVVPANALAGSIPPMMDLVTLTALGEKCPAAKGQEVYLAGYTVDGTVYNSLDHLEIESGHWFWSGERYCWRPETDSRQPDGITRSVILKIPVGWARTLDFASNEYRGKVQIQTEVGANTWVIDTYAPSETRHGEPIGRSATSVLILNQVRSLAVYACMLFALTGGMLGLVSFAHRHPDVSRAWLNRHNGKLIYFGISVVTFAFMVFYADRVQLWGDELHNLAFANGTIREAIRYCLEMFEVTPPLHIIIDSIWYHIAPYGLRWLLLLYIFMTCAVIFLTGVTGEKIGGKNCGVLAALLTAGSLTAWENVAYEFRSYAFLMFTSAIALCCYVHRNQRPERKRNVMFIISLTCLAMSHYFGMLACAGFFVADFVLVLKKKMTVKELILQYVFPGILSLVWICLALSTVIRIGGMRGNAEWHPVPSVTDFKPFLEYLSGKTAIGYYGILLGLAVGAVCLFRRGTPSLEWKRFHISFLFLMIVASIGLLYLWGHTGVKHTMWVNRYFLYLLPYVSVLSALAADNLAGMIGAAAKREGLCRAAASGFVGAALVFNCLAVVPKLSGYEYFRDSADWLYCQLDIYNDDTAVYYNVPYTKQEGWLDYYLYRQGRRDKLNILGGYDMLNVDEVNANAGNGLLAYRKLYVMLDGGIPASMQEVLNESFTMENDISNLKIRVFSRNDP